MKNYKQAKLETELVGQVKDLLSHLCLDELVMARDMLISYLKVNKGITFEGEEDD